MVINQERKLTIGNGKVGVEDCLGISRTGGKFGLYKTVSLEIKIPLRCCEFHVISLNWTKSGENRSDNATTPVSCSGSWVPSRYCPSEKIPDGI